MRLLHLALCTGLAAVALPAQNPVAYPQDSTMTGSGNLTPFGFLVGSVWLPLTTLQALNSGSVGNAGVSTLTLTLPNDPGLVGKRLVYQTAAVSGGRLVLTNATDHLINR